MCIIFDVQKFFLEKNENLFKVLYFACKYLYGGHRFYLSSATTIFVDIWYMLRSSPQGGGGGVHSREVWVGVCCGGLQTLTLLKTKIVHSDTLLKTRARPCWN